MAGNRESRRVKRERKTVRQMVEMYCRDNHSSIRLCRRCSAVLDYAWKRIEKCPFGEEKPVCTQCTVHCYRPDMRERIRDIMRYAGPRMMFRHPVAAIRHLIDRRRKMPVSKPDR